MQYHEVRIKSKVAYLVPISDVHIGSPGFSDAAYSLLCKNIEWVLATKAAYVFLNGDILHTATRTSKSNPALQLMNLEEQIKLAVRLLKPLAKADRLIGAIDGNHEARLIKFVGYSPTMTLCNILRVPYFRYSCVVNFMVGMGEGRASGKGNRIAYTGYFHHTTGGGSTPGGKINRIDRLRQIVANADFYVGSHNHQLGVFPVATHEIDVAHKRIIRLRQLLIDSGSYEQWEDHYPEQNQFQPTKLGSCRIRFDSGKHDIHCSV